MSLITETDGLFGSVLTADFMIEAVTLPALWSNQILDFVCCLVYSSMLFACNKGSQILYFRIQINLL